jgi:hypothetical protein
MGMTWIEMRVTCSLSSKGRIITRLLGERQVGLGLIDLVGFGLGHFWVVLVSWVHSTN